MKAIKYFVLICCTAFMATSCLDDMDIEQKSKITSSNMWLDESDAMGALYGLYHQFRGAFQTNIIYWGDYRAGTFTNGLGAGTSDKMFFNNLDSTEGKGTNWATLYTTINNANLILKHVPNIGFANEEKRNEILANAYFVRAYCYFQIARIWGDAPLLLEGFESSDADLQPSRTDVADIYTQVALDIEEAIRLMPETSTDPTIGSRMAALMLKADYNLWMAQTRNAGETALDAADAALDEVLQSPQHELIPSYADVFDINKKNNKEIIFTIHFAEGEYEGGHASLYLIPTSRWQSASKHIEVNVKLMTSEDQRYNFSQKLIDLMYEDPRDTRTAVSYGSWTDEDIGFTYTWINKLAGKWQDNIRYFISDEPIYRYAEALMFKAEIELAKGHVSTAAGYLNQVAQRAYGIENYYTTTDAATLRENLMDEYLKEFTAEGKSWWNYIRMGMAFTHIESLRGRQGETNILLWPIHANCMKENPNIRQTPGYN